jgi:hypothetical protein
MQGNSWPDTLGIPSTDIIDGNNFPFAESLRQNRRYSYTEVKGRLQTIKTVLVTTQYLRQHEELTLDQHQLVNVGLWIFEATTE